MLTRAPRDPRALRALVRLLVDAREPRRAVPFAKRLARNEGGDARELEAHVHVELAQVERAEGRSQAARKALRRGLDLDPRAVHAWIALGEVEAELGRSKDALVAWRRVPEVDRRAGPLVYPRIAATFAALGRARDYEAWLRELLVGDGDDPGARLALACALSARGAASEALDEVALVLDREPQHLEGARRARSHPAHGGARGRGREGARGAAGSARTRTRHASRGRGRHLRMSATSALETPMMRQYRAIKAQHPDAILF